MTSVLALALLIAAAPPAGSPVRPFLLSAAQLYQALEYEHALEQLERARKLPNRTADDDVQIALYEGIVLGELGRGADSSAAFRVALAIDPDATLPLKVSPKLEAQFTALLEKARKARDEFNAQQRQTAAGVAPAMTPTPEVAAPALDQEPPGGLRRRAWIPAVAGAVLVAAGAVSVRVSGGDAEQLKLPASSGQLSRIRENQLISEGQTLQTLGFVGIGVGASALAASLLLFAFGAPSETPQVGALIGPQQAGVMLTGTFP